MAIAQPTVNPVGRVTLRLRRISDWLEQKSTAHPWQPLAIFIALVIVVSLVRAARAKMWIDELYTYYSSHQANLADIIKAIQDGSDGAPPAYALLVHILQPVLGKGVMDLRIPALAGFCLMLVCVFLFVYRRLPALYAALAMLFAGDSVLYFATEGRAYGLVLGLTALSLVLWQMAVDGKHRVASIAAFVICMWAATALHYYSVLLLAPLFVAEVARWYESRKIDVPILAAFALVPLVLIPHIPLLEAQRQFVRYYHSKASILALFEFYVHYVGRYAVAFAAPVLLCALFGPRAGQIFKPRTGRSTLPVHEWALLLAMAVLPIVIVLGSMFTIKTFVDRYLVWTIIGFASLGAALLYRITRGSTTAAASVIALLLAGFAATSAAGIRKAPHLRESQAVRDELATAPAGTMPIVIADHHAFMELSYYADPRVRNRLVYVVSPGLERTYTGIDTGDLLMSGVARHTSLRIVKYDDFIKDHRQFLLAANAQDWLVWQFSRSGFHVKLLEPRWEPGLFEVTWIRSDMGNGR